MKYFESKAELIEFIKKQTNVELKNIDGFCGDNPDLLYAEIPKKERNLVLSVCKKHGIETNEHLNGRYWLYVKGGDYVENIEKCENEEINKDENWGNASKFLGMIFGISEEKRKEWTEQAKRDYYINKDGEGRCQKK